MKLTRGIRRSLTATLLATVTAGTLALTVTSSQAHGYDCAGGSYQEVCAYLVQDQEWLVRASAKAEHLNRYAKYKLTVRLEQCLNDGSGCRTVASTSPKYASGVSRFWNTTPSFNIASDGSACYKSKANLYRKGSDGVYHWLRGTTASWC